MNEKNDADAKPDKKKQAPPAGPHAKPELTDKDKTPGTGSLPDPSDKDQDSVSG